MSYLEYIKNLLWGYPILLLLVITGIYLTVKTNFIQIRLTRLETRNKSNDVTEGDIHPVQSLMTALAGAIGTGNITGIATALMTGGYGALFWMWVVAFFGMATAYTETVLSIKYRTINKKGEMLGGPMITLERGLKYKNLAKMFALFGILAAIGYGMVQANSVVDALNTIYDINRQIAGIIIMIFSAWVIVGGVKRIGRVATHLVPIMACIYLAMSLYTLGCYHHEIMPAFSKIFDAAFNGQAAFGGFLGSSVLIAIQTGAQYGIFANEAGLGSFAISASSAKVSSPHSQGVLSMSGVFLATMIICTITALVIIVTDTVGVEVNGVILNGSPLALAAFAAGNYHFPFIVMICLCLFAFTTILAWGYYGEKCSEYLFGEYARYYKVLYILTLGIGAVMSLQGVFTLAHLFNGLMAIPNLISLIMLVKYVKK